MRIPIAIAVLLCLAASTAAAQDGIKWTEDYKAALELSKEEGRPIVVHFWADW